MFAHKSTHIIQVLCTRVADRFQNHDVAAQRYCCTRSTLQHRRVVKSTTIL